MSATIPRHRLDGCTNRAIHQLDRAKGYLMLVAPVIPNDDDDPNRQFLYQSTVLMVQSFFEEYLRCIVSLGTFWKAPAVRAYLGQCHNDPARFASMSLAQIEPFAQERLSFKDDASRLKGIMEVIIGRSPFKDDKTERKCLDLINVRNIIAHRGGWPDDANVPTIESSNVVVNTAVVGNSKFYKLRISREFFAEALVGLYESIQTTEAALAADPAFQL